PPDGAVINYFLKNQSEATLEIFDAAGKLVRKFSTQDKPYSIPNNNVPEYWIRPQQILSGAPGSHRFVWDLHYTPLDEPASFSIAATYRNSAPRPTGPWVMPGTYTVKLTVGDQSFTQPLVVKMDPRVKSTPAQLQQQHDLSLDCYAGQKKVAELQTAVASLRKQVALTLPLVKKGTLPASLQQLDQTLTVENTELSRLSRAFAGVFNVLQDTDMPATSQALAAGQEAKTGLEQVALKWNALYRDVIPGINAQLKKMKLQGIE
ncbi:MAG TPA: glycoside hydrolase, partial [Haliscomenobacter sp.]|nr:glycoside hydrolase [Haliscomenobacter sp.]